MSAIGPFGALNSAAIPINADMATSKEIRQRARMRSLYIIAIQHLGDGSHWAFWVPRHDTSPFATTEQRTSSAQKLFSKVGRSLRRSSSSENESDIVSSNAKADALALKQNEMLGKVIEVAQEGNRDWHFQVRRNIKFNPKNDMSDIYLLGDIDGSFVVDTDVVEGLEEEQSIRNSQSLVEFSEQVPRDEFEKLAKDVTLPEVISSGSSGSLAWAGDVVRGLVDQGHLSDEAYRTVKGLRAM